MAGLNPELRAALKRLDPDEAALMLRGDGPMSRAGARTLSIAIRNGGFVSAGKGSRAGHVERVSAQSILALVRAGYLDHTYGSEGHVAGRLSQRSITRLVETYALDRDVANGDYQ